MNPRRDEFLSDRSIIPELSLFAVLWAVWFGWFYRAWPFWDDHAVYQMMAASWWNGGRPYVDAIDPNWAGALLVHAVAFALSGYAVWGFRLLDALLQFSLAVATFYWLAAWGVRRVWRILAVTLYAVTYLNTTFGVTGQREALALPFLAIGLLPWLLPEERVREWSWARLMGVHGVCLGLAVAIKPPLGLVMVAVGVGSLAVGVLPAWVWIRAVLGGAVGGLLTVGAMALLLWRVGGLSGFWQWGVVFAFTDYAALSVPWLKRGVHVLKWLTSAGALVTVAWAAAMILKRRAGQADGNLWGLAAWWTVGALTGALVQGKTNCLYHFLPLFFGMAIGTSSAFARSTWDESPIRQRSVLIALALLVVVSTAGFAKQSCEPTAGVALGRDLRLQLGAGDQVVLCGFSPSLYLALESPAPYPLLNGMLFNFMNETERDKEELRLVELVSDPRTRFFVVDSIAFETGRGEWARVERRPRLAAVLRECFQPPVLREARGNPQEFAQPVQFLLYERR